MISRNLTALRKMHHLTQEEAAEAVNVSRQALMKWEKGESLPDLKNCMALAELYNVTLDDLVNYSAEENGVDIPPKGKYFFGAVTVGERGQIVIPKKAREVFGIEPGDQLLLLGDVERGIGILPKKMLHDLLGLIGATLGEQGKWSGKRTKEEHDGRKRS